MPVCVNCGPTIANGVSPCRRERLSVSLSLPLRTLCVCVFNQPYHHVVDPSQRVRLGLSHRSLARARAATTVAVVVVVEEAGVGMGCASQHCCRPSLVPTVVVEFVTK